MSGDPDADSGGDRGGPLTRFAIPPRFVLKFYLYRVLVRVSFTAPIWYLYVLEKDVTYAGLGVVMAVWWGGLVAFEVPTGYLADRIGRRRSLLVAETTTVFTYVAMAFARGFLQFALVFLVWAAAATFRSGSATAWLYDSLEARLDAGEFTRIKGRADAFGLVSSGATAVVGGYVAEVSMELPWLVTGAVVALAVPLVYSFREQERYAGDEAGEGPEKRDGEGDGDVEPFTVVEGFGVLRERFSRPPLRSFVVLLGLVAGAFWGVNFFWQPMSRELGVSVHRLGWMYAGFTAIGAVASYRADWLEARLGIRRFFTLAPPALGALYLAIAVVPELAIPTFFLMQGVFRAANPLSATFINRRVESLGRATVLSGASLVRRLVIIPFQFSAGLLGDLLSPTGAIGLFGGLLLGGSVALLLVGTPFGAGSGDARAPAASDD